MHSWRNWIACQPPTLKVVGSIPAGCTMKKSPIAGFFSWSILPHAAADRAAEPHPVAALHKSVDKRQIAAYNLVRLQERSTK